MCRFLFYILDNYLVARMAQFPTCGGNLVLVSVAWKNSRVSIIFGHRSPTITRHGRNPTSALGYPSSVSDRIDGYQTTHRSPAESANTFVHHAANVYLARYGLISASKYLCYDPPTNPGWVRNKAAKNKPWGGFSSGGGAPPVPLFSLSFAAPQAKTCPAPYPALLRTVMAGICT